MRIRGTLLALAAATLTAGALPAGARSGEATVQPTIRIGAPSATPIDLAAANGGGCSGIAPILRDGDAPGELSFGCTVSVVAGPTAVLAEWTPGVGFTGAVDIGIVGTGVNVLTTCSWILGVEQGCTTTGSGTGVVGDTYLCWGLAADTQPLDVLPPVGLWSFSCSSY